MRYTGEIQRRWNACRTRIQPHAAIEREHRTAALGDALAQRGADREARTADALLHVNARRVERVGERADAGACVCVCVCVCVRTSEMRGTYTTNTSGRMIYGECARIVTMQDIKPSRENTCEESSSLDERE
jgi:hypothetical protein